MTNFYGILDNQQFHFLKTALYGIVNLIVGGGWAQMISHSTCFNDKLSISMLASAKLRDYISL